MLRQRPLPAITGIETQPCQSSEFGVPVSSLFVSVSILCACPSPLVAAAVIRALYAERWRSIGQHACLTGGIFAAKLIATCLMLHFLFGNAFPFRPVSIAVAGGAGFTVGALAACAWRWMRSTKT
jgi:hypothetical protein